MRLARVAILLLGVVGCLCAQRGPIHVEDIELLLALKVPSQTIGELAKQRGLSFPLNSEASRRIVAAGGDPELIGLLAESSVTPAKDEERPTAAPAAKRAEKNPKDAQIYVRVPAGTYKMGCSPADHDCGSDERPQHSVTISRDFWLGQTEVPAEAYQIFVGQTGGSMPAGSRQAGQPMVNVTWSMAETYCSWIGGRLPTEAEWEYAARAGATGVRYGQLPDIAWYASNSSRQIQPVGRKDANAFGLHDMLGNALEWLNDWYSPGYYATSPQSDPPGPPSGSERSVRGGSFSNTANVLRLSARDKNGPSKSYPNLGFRCVWNR